MLLKYCQKGEVKLGVTHPLTGVTHLTKSEVNFLTPPLKYLFYCQLSSPPPPPGPSSLYPTYFLIFRSAEKKALRGQTQFYVTPDMKRKDPTFTRVNMTILKCKQQELYFNIYKEYIGSLFWWCAAANI
jgi:hypothetical protein